MQVKFTLEFKSKSLQINQTKRPDRHGSDIAASIPMFHVAVVKGCDEDIWLMNNIATVWFTQSIELVSFSSFCSIGRYLVAVYGKLDWTSIHIIKRCLARQPCGNDSRRFCFTLDQQHFFPNTQSHNHTAHLTRFDWIIVFICNFTARTNNFQIKYSARAF